LRISGDIRRYSAISFTMSHVRAWQLFARAEMITPKWGRLRPLNRAPRQHFFGVHIHL